MTHANRCDFLDAHWMLVAEEKMWDMAELLLQRMKDNAQHVAKYQKEMADVRRIAGDANLEAAAEAFLRRATMRKKAVTQLGKPEMQV
jgi:hypothetical protein